MTAPKPLKKSFPKEVSPETATVLGRELLQAVVLHSRGKKMTTVEEISDLLDRGADVNITDLHGNTPLIWVAFEGSKMKDFIKLFLERGAHVNVENMYGNGAFVSAISSEDKEIINMFLARDDLDITLTGDLGKTACEILLEQYKNLPLSNLIESYPEMRRQRIRQKISQDINDGIKVPMKRPQKVILRKPPQG